MRLYTFFRNKDSRLKHASSWGLSPCSCQPSSHIHLRECRRLFCSNVMAQRDQRPTSPPMTTQLSEFAKATGRSSLSPLRNRPLSRAATFIENHPLRKRRSSTFSESASSLKSSTDNLLLPRAKSAEKVVHHDSSHWHSIPLALALLPAIGGLLFEKGGAIITDLTLLALAAVFLNWSVRLPW